ncbi:cytochrome o ubiquinol oxidase subunit IV [Rhizorhabdus argentea]|uniref:cytochrome o ubiquinol oxidase subunit IV n=1 Tax=Rhizorhabdus argentea TaxID=1387174 RepID=UPI0030EEA995
MTEPGEPGFDDRRDDAAPGDERLDGSGETHGLGIYVAGLALALALTGASFATAAYDLVWEPAIPAALIALAVAQIGVHLVFFLHITSGPEHTNNSLALAFGVFIVVLVVGGSIWIMDHLNHRMMPMDQMMQMQR